MTDSNERSLNGQRVLEEDEYTEALSQIIARDFFPSLVHLDATNSYLDAVRARDPALITASVRRLQDLSTPAASTRYAPYQTPSQTPYGQGPSETPFRTPRQPSTRGDEPPAKRPRFNTDMNLDAFQATYTSEDNSSFTEILEDENKKRREKWAWAWDAQKRVEAQRDKAIEGRERMLLEAAPAAGVREKILIEAPKPVGLIEAGPSTPEDDKGDEENQKAVVKAASEDEAPPVDVMARKKDTRPAGVDGWQFKARNSLMFPPDADVTPYTAPDPNAPQAAPKVVKYVNTRLPEQEDGPSRSRSLSAPPSPTRSRIDAAIAGTPYRPKSPTINNFSLVPAIPSPTPSELGPAAVKELMTWGTLNATPRLLSQSEEDLPPPSTPFHISAPSSREKLSHKLSTKAAKSLRARADLLGGGNGIFGRTPGGATGSARKGSMAPPSWTPRRADAMGALTPAAKRLLDRTTMGTAASRRADAMGRMAGWEGKGKSQDLERVRWTPTPSPVTRR